MNRSRIVLLGMAIILGTGITLAASDLPSPPGPPNPPPGNPQPPGIPQVNTAAPLGAGCLGGEFQTVIFFAADGTLGITWQEFQDTYATDTDGDGRVNYLPWMRGNFDPTTPRSPCAEGAFD